MILCNRYIIVVTHMVPDAPSLHRTKSLTTKVTEEEYARLQELATAAGQSMGEWARTVLLAQVNSSQEIILAEVLALRMLYLNSVQILGQKRELTTDELRKLIERVDGEKRRKAKERLREPDGNGPGADKSANVAPV
jgi:hypothetical protein